MDEYMNSSSDHEDKSKKENKVFRDYHESCITDINPETIDKYTIEDVVWPILSKDVMLPLNPKLTAIIDGELEKDGVKWEMYNNDRYEVPWPEPDIKKGSYRPIIGRANNVTFDIVES
jgi:hypothetical protein